MLSDRERAILAGIERNLIMEDPKLEHLMRSLAQPTWWQQPVRRKPSGRPE